MPTVHLAGRALIEVAGAQSESFLQNIITPDLGGLGAGEARPGALLTPQGKILFDFLISRAGEGLFLLECRGDVAEDFIKRLMLYRLRAKVDISLREQDVVAVSWDADSSAYGRGGAVVDRRFSDAIQVLRHCDDLPAADAAKDDWTRLRIAYGVAESGADYALGDAFPHDILFDQNGGVGLKKGCFVGQEVVSRMQHRGTARRRLMIATGEAALPPAGTDITANDRAIGTLGSVVANEGLAVVRIDRVASAREAGQPIRAAAVAIDLAVPSWARFTLAPDARAEGGE